MSSVMILTAMPDATSRQGQREKQPGKQKEFSRILEERQERLQEKRGLEGKAVGYNKNGQICFCQIMPRVYN